MEAEAEVEAEAEAAAADFDVDANAVPEKEAEAEAEVRTQRAGMSAEEAQQGGELEGGAELRDDSPAMTQSLTLFIRCRCTPSLPTPSPLCLSPLHPRSIALHAPHSLCTHSVACSPAHLAAPLAAPRCTSLHLAAGSRRCGAKTSA